MTIDPRNPYGATAPDPRVKIAKTPEEAFRLEVVRATGMLRNALDRLDRATHHHPATPETEEPNP